MNWITNNEAELIAALGAVILLTVGRAKLLPKAQSSKHPRLALWVAFVVTVVCGLMLGVALHGVAVWLTSRTGGAGTAIASIGAVFALLLGWHSMYMIVALVRDLADGQPDRPARHAALMLPTCLPAGWAAVTGLIMHPRDLGTGLTAAIMAVITVVYTMRISKAALSSKNHKVEWKWFAAAVCVLAGIVMVPLILYVDATLAGWLSGPVLTLVRVCGGLLGVALGVAAVADICDRVPDAAVRAFLAYGIPLLFLFGSVATATISGPSKTGLDLIVGSMR